MNANRTYWFGPKRIGFGFSPNTWQGWTATGVYVLLMFALPQLMGHAWSHTARLACGSVLTIAFLVVFFWKLDISKR